MENIHLKSLMEEPEREAVVVQRGIIVQLQG